MPTASISTKRITEDGSSTRITKRDEAALWTWCPMPGASRQSKLAVDIAAYGDGYQHRATRGLNPVRPTWNLSFPFTSLDELQEMDEFLRAFATAGFFMTPPDGTDLVRVTADEWSASIIEKNLSSGIVGQLSVTVAQSFNPQPL